MKQKEKQQINIQKWTSYDNNNCLNHRKGNGFDFWRDHFKDCSTYPIYLASLKLKKKRQQFNTYDTVHLFFSMVLSDSPKFEFHYLNSSLTEINDLCDWSTKSEL